MMPSLIRLIFRPVKSGSSFLAVFLLAILFASTELKTDAATLATWDGNRSADVVNFVSGKHLVVKAGEKTETIAVDDLVLLQYSPLLTRDDAQKTPPYVWLSAAGHFSVTRIESDGSQFSYDSTFAGNGTVSVNNVSAIAFQKNAFIGTLGTEFRKYLNAPPKTDVLVVTGKDGGVLTLEGVFIKLDDKNITFRWHDKDQQIARNRLLALVLAPVEKSAVNRNSFAAVIGRNGAALEGELADLNNESATLISPAVGKVTIPISLISEIDFVRGRSVFVSSLEPVKVEEMPYFDVVFPYRRDTSVIGTPLTLGGVQYERGLGVHSKCAISYALNGEFRQLIGWIGIDDGVGQTGNVVFKVIADGKPIYTSSNVRGGDAPRRISLNVANIKSLTLEVDFGDDMDIGDHANWADLKLIR